MVAVTALFCIAVPGRQIRPDWIVTADIGLHVVPTLQVLLVVWSKTVGSGCAIVRVTVHRVSVVGLLCSCQQRIHLFVTNTQQSGVHT